ncbi:hypothetical protein BGZ88_000021 [Linnemannia elongata]|nr:hypothetical protein BGZ88_000021 [Linnemannia elongata]KAG0066293.1 hypothetical protein BGZ89_007421 [Linnemannia elongata]KAK5828825.1 hypothetical protein F5H01DRAFT_328982 [Linnemannia elongata]
MRLTTTTTLLASTALLALTSAQGQIASVDSADSYCFFLPPMVGGDIAANEDSAIAFCNKENPKAPGAKVFPDGFVASVHWASGDGWVQITGQIDPSKYGLNPCDAGGQYDIRAPVGASCAGYSHFVNVLEPTDGLYAMRCCQNSADCVVSKSTYGVRVIFGEQWDWSGPHPDGLLPAAQGCVNGQLPGGGNGTVTIGVPTATATVTSSSVTSTQTVTVPVVNGTASSGVAGPTSTGGAGNKPTPTPAGGNANKAAVVVSALLATAIGLFMA